MSKQLQNVQFIESTTCSHTDAPQYTAELEYRVREEETEYRIDILLDANPKPNDTQFSWFFNGNRLIDGENGITLRVDSIQFDVINRERAGTYRVESHNGAGSGGVEFQLTVQCRDNFTFYIINNLFMFFFH